MASSVIKTEANHENFTLFTFITVDFFTVFYPDNIPGRLFLNYTITILRHLLSQTWNSDTQNSKQISDIGSLSYNVGSGLIEFLTPLRPPAIQDSPSLH